MPKATIPKKPVMKKPVAAVSSRGTPVMKKPAAASGKDSFADFLRSEKELDTGDASGDDGGTDNDGGAGSTRGHGSSGDKYTPELR